MTTLGMYKTLEIINQKEEKSLFKIKEGSFHVCALNEYLLEKSILIPVKQEGYDMFDSAIYLINNNSMAILQKDFVTKTAILYLPKVINSEQYDLALSFVYDKNSQTKCYCLINNNDDLVAEDSISEKEFAKELTLKYRNSILRK